MSDELRRKLLRFAPEYSLITARSLTDEGFIEMPLLTSHSSLLTLFYPFSPLVAMPSIKYFCRARNTTETGTREQTDTAMIRW